jgi:magnesium transporter
MVSRLDEQNLKEPVSKYMRGDFITLNQDESIAQAEKHLRGVDIKGEILYLYVTNEKDRLVGVVPVRKLITSDPKAKISSIMIHHPVSVSTANTVLHACELFAEHRFLALPVVDDSKKILGIVDINLFTDEIVSITQQRHLDNVFQLIGVHVTMGKKVSTISNFRGRFPWLLCNISSGIICAFIASHFELLISQVAVLAMFITVVLAISESVSIQSMTLTLQVLLHQQTSWRRIFNGIRKEFVTAMMIGAASGIVVGFIAFLWKNSIFQGAAIGVSIFLAVISACLLGVIVPTIIRKMKIDLKVAAGPIVLAATDIATLIFYFFIANLLLS